MSGFHHSEMPSKLLVDQLQGLPRGRALDLATGYGRNALYLASQGYAVEGAELSEGAVLSCRQEATRRGLSVDIQQVDLERHRLKRDAYDLITCFYYLDRNLFPQIEAALKSGGMIVYETFLIDQRERYGIPGRIEFCLRHNELLSAFYNLRVRFYREGEVEGAFIAQLIAEKSDRGPRGTVKALLEEASVFPEDAAPAPGKGARS